MNLSEVPAITCLSPCKLNLFLYIVGRRPDGYHNLQTLFTLLDYGDEITFTQNSSHNGVNIVTDFGFPPQKNLIYKAAMLLTPMARCPCGIDISVKKVLPQGGGLGGGSSNAATTLLALNEIWRINLGQDELEHLGLTLGSDVPIFIHGRTAFAEGRGEMFTNIKLPPETYLVATPKCHVSTQALFQDPSLSRNTPRRTLTELLDLPFANDFEGIVTKLYPEVRELLKILPQYNPDECASLTGSGGCCFVKVCNLGDGQCLQDMLWKRHKINSFVARTLPAPTTKLSLLRIIHTEGSN